MENFHAYGSMWLKKLVAFYIQEAIGGCKLIEF